MTEQIRPSDPDESVLLDAARAGDERAFAALVERHRAGLEEFCGLMLGDQECAAHAVGDAVLTAWRERGPAPGSTSVRIWLHRLAISACLEVLELPAMSFRRDERLTD